MGGWASKASRLCWSLHPKGSTDFATRVQWRACASHTGGGEYVFPKNLTPGTWKWIPFGKGKASTRNHQLLGFQLSIFVGMLISGMCLGRIGMFPLRKPRGSSFLGEVFWHRLFALMWFLFRVPKTYLTKSAHNSFCVFCRGTGERILPLGSTFSTMGLVRKKAKDHGMILLKQKKVWGVNVRSTWFTILTFHKSHLFKKKYILFQVWAEFLLPFSDPVGFFSISPFPAVLFQPEKNQVKKAPRCQLPCFRWQLGWWVDGLMDGWFREFPKMPGRVALLFLLQKSRRMKLELRLQDFFPSTAMVSCGESGWWKIFIFDKNSLLYYFWKLRLWGKVDESEREILSDGWLQVEGRILLLNTW